MPPIPYIWSKREILKSYTTFPLQGLLGTCHPPGHDMGWLPPKSRSLTGKALSSWLLNVFFNCLAIIFVELIEITVFTVRACLFSNTSWSFQVSLDALDSCLPNPHSGEHHVHADLTFAEINLGSTIIAQQPEIAQTAWLLAPAASSAHPPRPRSVLQSISHTRCL